MLRAPGHPRETAKDQDMEATHKIRVENHPVIEIYRIGTDHFRVFGATLGVDKARVVEHQDRSALDMLVCWFGGKREGAPTSRNQLQDAGTRKVSLAFSEARVERSIRVCAATIVNVRIVSPEGRLYHGSTSILVVVVASCCCFY